ncbi:MAG: DNA primase [Legionellaceae bacterium]
MVGLIPRLFIDELLSKTDIVAFIDSYVPLKKQGTAHVACCPFHNEKSPSFNVIPKKQFYHCFGCGASGNAISFAMAHLNQGFPEAVETLAARMGMHVPREGDASKHQSTLSLYQLMTRVTHYYQKNLRLNGAAAIAYLKNRGVDGKTAHQYQIGYASPEWHGLEAQFKAHQTDLTTTGMLIQKEGGNGRYDRYRHRIMFPIHDRQGRIIGFGGRAIDGDQKPKYLNSPETVIFQKNRELYGLHQVLQHTNHPQQILVVEGYMDVIALAQHGIHHAVATLGTATSGYHIQLMSKHTNTVIFCFDGDHAGRQAAWRALENTLPELDNALDARFIFLPEGHDPDSLVREEGQDAFLKRLETATPLHQFFFETLSQGIDTRHLAGKNLLIAAVKPYLAKIPEGSYKQLLLDELTRLTHLDFQRIADLIEKKTPAAEPQQQVLIRTPLRIAIALLLQHPDLYARIQHDFNKIAVTNEKMEIIHQLIQHIVREPTPSTAALVEFFRGTPLFETLNKLATWDTQVPEGALVDEFIDTLNFLSKQTELDEAEELLERARKQGLDEADRQRLQTLLKKRHEKIESIKTQ